MFCFTSAFIFPDTIVGRYLDDLQAYWIKHERGSLPHPTGTLQAILSEMTLICLVSRTAHHCLGTRFDLEEPENSIQGWTD